MKKTILLLIVCALAVAFATNPSESEAKEMITAEMSTRLKQTVDGYAEDNGVAGQLVSALTGLFGSSLVDLCTNIKVNNYYFFSTYEVTYVIDKQEADESGTILFGKLLPRSSK